MGCAGDPVAHTPFLDSLAGEGVRFTHMISAHGQCVPSRASLITGRYPHECGVVVNYGFHGHQNRLSPTRFPTLGQVFREAGYRTAWFGKCHFGVPLPDLGWEEGIDHDDVRVDDDEADRIGLGSVPQGLRRDYVAARDTVAWLREYEPDGRPLFLTFSTNLPAPALLPRARLPRPLRRLHPGTAGQLPWGELQGQARLPGRPRGRRVPRGRLRGRGAGHAGPVLLDDRPHRRPLRRGRRRVPPPRPLGRHGGGRHQRSRGHDGRPRHAPEGDPSVRRALPRALSPEAAPRREPPPAAGGRSGILRAGGRHARRPGGSGGRLPSRGLVRGPGGRGPSGG